MPETIILTVAAEVASGPKLKETRGLEVDAYDKITVTVPDGTSDLEVDLQPGGTGSVRLLVVKSNVYGGGLTYTGSVGLYGAEPRKLVFDNTPGASEDAQPRVLVGREATP